MVDENHELLNLRVVLVTTQAAILSAPGHAETHRRRASQLLDEAYERTGSGRIRQRIEVLRRELNGGSERAKDESQDT